MKSSKVNKYKLKLRVKRSKLDKIYDKFHRTFVRSGRINLQCLNIAD